MNIFEIQGECRANFNIYLREVMSHMPQIDGACVLDIGCGSGVSSCEIARNSDYCITAMDIDDAALNVFREKIADTVLVKRIDIVRGTFETAIAQQMAFDIVLAEGLFNIIGFKTGLRQTCAVLKTGGYLVLHDGQDVMESKRAMIDACGFEILETFALDETVWWDMYCGCLEKSITGVDEDDLSSGEKKHLVQGKADIALYHESPQSFRSIYYLLKKHL